jgi:two-component system sensor histidine kinase TctE
MTISIRTNLLTWLIGPLLLINLMGGGLTFWLAWAPTQTAWDQSLADAAWALVPRLKDSNGTVTIDLPQQAEQVLRVDHFDSIFFVVRDLAGHTLAGDHDFPLLPALKRIDEVQIDNGTMRGEPIRIVSLKAMIGINTVYLAAAETLRKRTHSHWIIVVALLLIEALLTCLSIAVVWIAVKKGLLPLQKMQSALNSRHAIDLSPVENVHAPVELDPLLIALNALLLRAQDGAQAQQDFLANVAHQLRTPLAGLRIHLEWLQQRHAVDTDSTHTTEMMMSSIARMIRQTNQLLALARAEPSQFVHASLDKVALDELVTDSVQQFVRQADIRDVDLGFDLQPTTIVGDRFLLRDLIDNLIDNAIRYTPIRGTVTVRCRQQEGLALIIVEDNGPGIDPVHRNLVFARFYRVDHKIAGTGLGLAIVRDIAMDHSAQITIESGPGGVGTSFTVAFPMPG